MNNCKNLISEDVTPWHGDVFDYPTYKTIYNLIEKEVITCINYNEK